MLMVNLTLLIAPVEKDFREISRMRHLHLPVLLMVVVLFLPGITEASRLWIGEIASPVNLRQGPNLDSKVISVLGQGQKVDVVEMKNNWFMVVMDKGTYGFRGWVYGDYLVRVSNAEPPEDKPIPLVKTVESKNPLTEDVPETGKPIIKKTPPPAEATPPRVQEASADHEKTDPGPLEHTLEPIPDKAKSHASARESETAPVSAARDHAGGRPIKEQTKLYLRPENAGTDSSQAPRGKDLIMDHTVNRKPSAEGKGMETRLPQFVGLLLKLTLVIFCCASLVLSAKAYSIAKESRRARSSAFTYDQNLMKIGI
jgi:hypothetical protein